MKLKKRWIAIIIIGALCVSVIMLALWPSSGARVSVPLSDGTTLMLTDTDSGKTLLYGGGQWQRLLCKIIGKRLPHFVRNQPFISQAAYTNGIALSLSREATGTNALSTPWNGSGRLYLLDHSGTEVGCALHAVNFATEKRGTNVVVDAEEMSWEAPIQNEAELRFRIRETNRQTGAVSTHDFRVKNPAM